VAVVNNVLEQSDIIIDNQSVITQLELRLEEAYAQLSEEEDKRTQSEKMLKEKETELQEAISRFAQRMGAKLAHLEELEKENEALSNELDENMKSYDDEKILRIRLEAKTNVLSKSNSLQANAIADLEIQIDELQTQIAETQTIVEREMSLRIQLEQIIKEKDEMLQEEMKRKT